MTTDRAAVIRQGVDELVGLVESLTAQRDALLAELKRLEWSVRYPRHTEPITAPFGFGRAGPNTLPTWDYVPACGTCGGTIHGGHAPDCTLAAAIRIAEATSA